MEMSKPVIIVLAHRRVSHLKEVLSAVRNAEKFDKHNLIVMVDESSPEVLELLRGLPFPDFLLSTRPAPEDSALKKIGRSLAIGLDLAFGRLNAPYVVVLDDDIVVSPIFLSFVERCHRDFSRNFLFRGVNGWSVIELEPGFEDSCLSISRINYGYAWGWSISLREFNRVKKFLNNPRMEESAPDWLFEPYLRTGFMVNPVGSLVKNIGFDETATHTKSPGDSVLGSLIQRSFDSHNHASDTLSRPFDFSLRHFPWHQAVPCIEFERLNPLERFLLLGLNRLIWSVLRASLLTRGPLANVLQKFEKRLRRARKKFPVSLAEGLVE
jgi:GR25 family glycosyltransferase involved in LPS biosynthesis